MADESTIVHLMVELGPDKGRRITVPDAGARIGRSSQNDIELTDPGISRFQCRVFFKPDGLLWIADLGSTNETLVNAKPVLESKLNVGDRIEIGESIIRVVADNLKGIVAAPPPVPPPAASAQPAFAPPPAFAPLTADVPPPPPLPTAEKIDLGLSREPEAEAAAPEGQKAGARKFMWLVLVLALAIAAVAVLKSGLLKPSAPGSAAAAKIDGTFSVYYEKVNGSSSNIFRYALTLEGGKLSVQIDSLRENRHVSREKKPSKDVLDKLRGDLEGGGFFKLDENYQGLQPNVYDSADLEIVAGTRNRRVIVLNRIEPDDFRHTRETIEEFAKSELGLITISLSPDKLVALARDACLLGQKLYGEREVKYENLWGAIHAFDEAKFYLDTVEPKPDFFRTVVDGQAQCHKELTEQVESYKFQADKARKLQDWKTAAENLRIMMEMMPDNSIQEYHDKYRVPAEKELVDVERRLDKRSKR